MFETYNRFEMKGRIESIREEGDGNVRFFINSYINKRDVNILMYSDYISDDIKNGDVVIVSGYVSVKPLEFRRPGQRYRQRFNATEIIRSTSEMEKEFGVEGKYHSSDYFLAAFQGLIAGATKTNSDWAKITIMVDNDRIDRYPSRISLDYQLKKNRYLSLPEFDFKSGDRVRVICSITTTEKEYDGENLHFQNFKIEDIQRVYSSRVEADATDDDDFLEEYADIDEEAQTVEVNHPDLRQKP